MNNPAHERTARALRKMPLADGVIYPSNLR